MKRLFQLLFTSSWRLIRKFSIEPTVRHWYPSRFLAASETSSNFALVILNSRPLTDFVDRRYIKSLWPKAKIRVCADGGLNKLAALNMESGTDLQPDFVCGDLDSAKKENIDHCKQHGTAVYEDKSTDSTDYTKCLRLLAQQLADDQHKTKVDTIVTVGGLCGRFDHVMGCLNTLSLLQKEHPALSIYCVQYCSLVTLLPPGRHIIHVDKALSTGVCGLAPIGRPAERVTTTGLEWDLDNQTLAFGTLVSTSNHVKSSEVHVRTDAPLLWIMNLRS